jgi:hypothetical protein
MSLVIFRIVEGSWVFCILEDSVVFSPLHNYLCNYSRVSDATSSINTLYSFLWCHE